MQPNDRRAPCPMRHANQLYISLRRPTTPMWSPSYSAYVPRRRRRQLMSTVPAFDKPNVRLRQKRCAKRAVLPGAHLMWRPLWKATRLWLPRLRPNLPYWRLWVMRADMWETPEEVWSSLPYSLPCALYLSLHRHCALSSSYYRHLSMRAHHSTCAVRRVSSP